MELETISAGDIFKERVKLFIEGMKPRRFEGPLRGKLDTFLLLTYDQANGEDTVNFLSWAVDSSRANEDYIKTELSYLELPEKYNHTPYPRTNLQYYDDIMPKDGKRIPAIAFGIGPSGRKILYRRKGMSTKAAFERLKVAVGL